MLSPDKSVAQVRNEWGEEAVTEAFDFDQVISAFRRQWLVVALSILIALMIGLGYVTTALPLYTASASVVIDRGQSALLSELSAVGLTVSDEATVLSEIEIMHSDAIALAVVDKLDLTRNPGFVNSSTSLLGGVKDMVKRLANFNSWFADTVPAATNDDLREAAATQIIANMDVERAGKSYVLTVYYTSPSPQLSSQIANTIADTYIVDKLNSKYDATRRASDWLQQRIQELKEKALETDLAVQTFRRENNLMTTASGALVSDQQLSELSSALISAQAASAEAEAKYKRIRTIVDQKRTDALVSDILDSSVANDLRKRYLDASKREAEISSRLGSNHVQAVRLRKEMEEYQRLLFGELGRLAESYQSEVDVTKARENELRARVDAATNISATAGETQVQLRELERNAETYRNLYQSFLSRFQEATQQQSFPVTDARVITRANIPWKPSYPKTPLMLALFGVLGVCAGAGIGGFREFRDRFFRTGDHVRDNIGLEYLGSTPLVEDTLAAGDMSTDAKEREIQPLRSAFNYVVDHPLSAFAETLRSVKVALDFNTSFADGGKVVGMVSTLPDEGKSTLSSNFAQLLAMHGAKVLLIDGDLRNAGLTRAIGRHARVGVLEILTGKARLEESILFDKKTRLAFLPAVVNRRVPHSSQLVSSPEMAAMLESARKIFDYIVIDLPPVGPVVDARAISPLVDQYVFVIEWGRTARKVVRTHIQREHEIFEKCVGVILNKLDKSKIKLYKSYGSDEHYASRYSSYYHE